jgi:chromosome segregation ATPase
MLDTPPSDGKKRNVRKDKKDKPPFSLPLGDDKENNKNATNSNLPPSTKADNQPCSEAATAPAASSVILGEQKTTERKDDASEMRKRREEVERLQSEKRDLEEMVAFLQQRLKKKGNETETGRIERERLASEVISHIATINGLKEKITVLEMDLARLTEEKTIEEEKSRQLAQLHADQAHQHAAQMAQEQKQHSKELSEEREKAQKIKAQLEQSRNTNVDLQQEVEKVRCEMREMKESREATQQLSTLNAIKDAFALQVESQKKENETLTQQVCELQRQLFFTLALALKLNSSLIGRPSNNDVHSLWEKAQQIAFTPDLYSRWLSLQFAEVQQSEN